MIGWIIVSLVVLWLANKAYWHLRMWYWRSSIRDPKEHLEAKILWARHQAVTRGRR
jgi:hypothetical protein